MLGDRPEPQFGCNARLTSQESKNFLELDTNLLDDLLTLARVGSGFVARKFLSCAADRETILIEKASDLPDD